jgi:hypothetical protein
MQRGLVGENADAAFAMLAAELLDFLLDGAVRRLMVVEHQALGRVGIDAVGLDGKVVVVAADKRHRLKTRKEKREKRN